MRTMANLKHIKDGISTKLLIQKFKYLNSKELFKASSVLLFNENSKLIISHNL